jgi:chloride channel protein, CIC family
MVCSRMTFESSPSAGQPAQGHGSLLVLAALALLVGTAAGGVGALFRIALEHADQWRNDLITWAHNEGFAGFLLVVMACTTAPLFAAWLVRHVSPYAGGSGIPHVEAVLREEIPQAPFHLIWVKFIGGLLAIGSGLALGREGPSVQMGASVALLVGRVFRRNWADCRVLFAAGAGAGLATAFNAPIAGAVFVLEELVRRFEPHIAIAAVGASATAIAVARLFLGDSADFYVDALAYPKGEAKPLFFVLGALAGFLAIAYNRSILGAIALVDKVPRLPPEWCAAVIGAMVGVVAWFAPGLVGGGDPITQGCLSGVGTLAMLPLLFLLRFGLGTLSYAAKTPGGLFAPMLVLGAQLGLFFGIVSRLGFPSLDIQPEAFAVVGMAAFFTGVVRAPLTGMVLVTEMTGSVTMLLPMLGACFVAMLVPTLLGDVPIYDALRERTTRQDHLKTRCR